jgi:hypothetical protein
MLYLQHSRSENPTRETFRLICSQNIYEMANLTTSPISNYPEIICTFLRLTLPYPLLSVIAE